MKRKAPPLISNGSKKNSATSAQSLVERTLARVAGYAQVAEPLDEEIARLLALEAARRISLDTKVGIGGYGADLSPPSKKPNINKNFLVNTIKSVSVHNRREEEADCWRTYETQKVADQMDSSKRPRGYDEDDGRRREGRGKSEERFGNSRGSSRRDREDEGERQRERSRDKEDDNSQHEQRSSSISRGDVDAELEQETGEQQRSISKRNGDYPQQRIITRPCNERGGSVSSKSSSSDEEEGEEGAQRKQQQQQQQQQQSLADIRSPSSTTKKKEKKHKEKRKKEKKKHKKKSKSHHRSAKKEKRRKE